jgi:hypothetical protein
LLLERCNSALDSVFSGWPGGLPAAPQTALPHPDWTLAIAPLAIATQAYAQFLPPEEFDRPFDGRVVIQLARDQDEVRKLCPGMIFTMEPLGCSFRIRGLALCAIVKVSDDQIRAAGYDPEVFMRHELGHCNGWGSDHKGAR